MKERPRCNYINMSRTDGGRRGALPLDGSLPLGRDRGADDGPTGGGLGLGRECGGPPPPLSRNPCMLPFPMLKCPCPAALGEDESGDIVLRLRGDVLPEVIRGSCILWTGSAIRGRVDIDLKPSPSTFQADPGRHLHAIRRAQKCRYMAFFTLEQAQALASLL